MSELVAWFDSELSTDFALLATAQHDCREDAETTTYAASAPGVVALMCGTKYADLRVRLERWSGPPPPADELWEDCDELPWAAVREGGLLQVAGFDPPAPDEGGLPVADMGRARVQVLAWGRHRYRYEDGNNDGLPRERWLLRFWPDPEARDALAGAPRRLAGPLPFESCGRSAWRSAMHAWEQSGWHFYFLDFPAFLELERSIGILGRPFDPDELVPRWGPWGRQLEQAGRYRWESPALGHGWATDLRETPGYAGRVSRLEALAGAAGLSAIETFRDAFTCLSAIGLLAQDAQGSFVPKPAPRVAWEVLELPDAQRHELQRHALRSDFGHLERDIGHVLRWAPDGRLTTTPRALAVRLAIPPADVLGALRLINHERGGSLIPGHESFDADTEITLVRG